MPRSRRSRWSPWLIAAVLLTLTSVQAPLSAQSNLASITDFAIVPEQPDSCYDEMMESIEIYMDDEDKNNQNSRSGWMGAFAQDSNTRFRFCRLYTHPQAYGPYFFKPLRIPAGYQGDPRRFDYAVLKLGDACPEGGRSFYRRFDNEDKNNQNYTIMGDGNPMHPNYQTRQQKGYTVLHFCFFQADPSLPASKTMDRFPNLGVNGSISYGVLAAEDFLGGVAHGTLWIDDEDKNNTNNWAAPVYNFDAIRAKRIIGAGSNSMVRLAKVIPNSRVGLPFAPNSLALAGVHGVLGNDPQGHLLRAHWINPGGWNHSVVPHWSGWIVPGSLISGWDNVFGVNNKGKMIATWMNDGTLTFAVIEETHDLVPGSLALGGYNVFGVDKSGNLVRAYWQGNHWNFETVSSWGGRVVAGSLVQGDGNVYGVNEYGQIVHTWLYNGAVTYDIQASSQDVVPGSLAFAGDHVFGITKTGQLARAYWQGNAWKFTVVPSWGSKLVPGSLIRGEGNRVYGVNEQGQIFNTWDNQGTVTFGLLPVTNVVPGSLAFVPNQGVFGIDKSGRLVRAYWTVNGWQSAIIPSWGGRLRADSLISAPDRVYGITEYGKLFNTWLNNGIVTYGLID